MKNSVNNDYPVLKGRLLATLVLLLCVMMIGTAVAQSFGVVSRTETLNLRSQGSSSSQWLGSYSRGTWVEITGSQNNFYYVRTPDGKTGYMSKNYIDVSGESGTARIALVTNQNGGSFLNFRAQPRYDAQVLGIFDRCGSLEAGKNANAVVLDADLNVKAVFFRGCQVQ